MENEEIGNTDKDNVLYLNDVSFVSVNDTQSLTLDNESLVNSEDSLPISGTHVCSNVFIYIVFFFIDSV